ncbi:hypothetical protein ACFQH2_05280 [Natronoarchaeum sp. GCM10025703]|uniref:hypothetical protein n=1 Tax=unclassified Natronoarchaeum TaxID=2620183 RepID=UPI00361D16FD
MSGSDDEVGRREVAYRVFAAEFEDATLDYKESDEERAPNYVITPTGARVNRMFVVGVLTEIEQVNENVLRARVVDPTGAFVIYAGQYQPDEMAFLERTDPPAFLAVTGKARTFQPDDSDRVFTSIRPESINQVDADTRDRWIVGTAEQTLDRVATMATAIERPEAGDELESLLVDGGADPAHASGVRLALEHYGTTPEYLAAIRDLAVEATEVVAGERDEVSSLDVAPDEGDGSVTVDDLPDTLGELPEPAAVAESTEDEATEATETAGDEADSTPTASANADESAEESEPAVDPPDASVEESADSSETTASAESSETTASTDVTESTDEVDVGQESEDVSPATEGDESATPAEGEETTGAKSVGNFDTAGDAEAEAESADAEADAEAVGVDADAEAVDAEADTEAVDVDADTEPIDTGTDAESIDADASDEEGAAATGEMYEFSEDEREEIEEEYGTEFSTGTEVPDPGESEIETPDTGDTEESEAQTADEPADDTASTAEESEEDTAVEQADEATDEVNIPDDVTLTDVVIETMQEMDTGDGVDRYDLINEVIENTGMTEPDVKDAIEEALMGGRCYEPTDDTLKPI